MSLAVFNTEENLGEFDKFKLLPDELQNHIGRYVDEIYNEINNYTCNWYDIIDTIGCYYGWIYLVDFLNKNYAVLLGGSLTKVPKSAFPKEMLFEESQWFTANYQQVSQTMIDVFKNYSKYLVKSKQLQFRLLVMTF